MLVVVGNQKGGVGKTTIAVHLAAAWARRHRVLLVDADPQEAATGWLGDADTTVEVVQPKAQTTLAAFLEGQAPRYDAVIVDLPPGLDRPLRDAIRVADILVVPLSPSPVEVRSARSVLELAQILRGPSLDVRLILTRVVAGTVLGRTARDGLAPYGVPIAKTILHHRIAVQEAAALSRSVFAYAPDSLAADEFTALARELGREVFAHGIHRDEGAVGTRGRD
jgi:chromosome partitioning protein